MLLVIPDFYWCRSCHQPANQYLRCRSLTKERHGHRMSHESEFKCQLLASSSSPSCIASKTCIELRSWYILCYHLKCHMAFAHSKSPHNVSISSWDSTLINVMTNQNCFELLKSYAPSLKISFIDCPTSIRVKKYDKHLILLVLQIHCAHSIRLHAWSARLIFHTEEHNWQTIGEQVKQTQLSLNKCI
jgi:hypothetical protein